MRITVALVYEYTSGNENVIDVRKHTLCNVVGDSLRRPRDAPRYPRPHELGPVAWRPLGSRGAYDAGVLAGLFLDIVKIYDRCG
jgi:hypothetical protein